MPMRGYGTDSPPLHECGLFNKERRRWWAKESRLAPTGVIIHKEMLSSPEYTSMAADFMRSTVLIGQFQALEEDQQQGFTRVCGQKTGRGDDEGARRCRVHTSLMRDYNIKDMQKQRLAWLHGYLIGWKAYMYDDMRRIGTWVLLQYCHGIRIILDGVVGVDCLID